MIQWVIFVILLFIICTDSFCSYEEYLQFKGRAAACIFLFIYLFYFFYIHTVLALCFSMLIYRESIFKQPTQPVYSLIRICGSAQRKIPHKQ